MHILAILVALLCGLGVLLWRLNTAVQAAKGLNEAANDAKGFFRRRRWQNQLLADRLDGIDDARMAAATMMVAIAQNDGALTEKEQKTILSQIATRFNAKPPLDEEMLAYARWVVQESRDLGYIFGKLKPVIQSECGPAEIKELLEMLEDVAGADGALHEEERHELQQLRRSLQDRRYGGS